MKFDDLKIGDELICLRIKDNIAIHINLKITARSHYKFNVISDTLDTYTFTVPSNKEINEKLIILDNGSEICDENIREYLFESIDDCKNFANDYYKQKIANYEKTLETIKTWS